MSINALYMEHRWGTRVEMFTPANVTTAAGRSYKAVVRNASLSGAFLATLAHLPVLSRFVLKPLVPDADWSDACVVRTNVRGVGVEWLDPQLRPVSTLLAMRSHAYRALSAHYQQQPLVEEEDNGGGLLPLLEPEA